MRRKTGVAIAIDKKQSQVNSKPQRRERTTHERAFRPSRGRRLSRSPLETFLTERIPQELDRICKGTTISTQASLQESGFIPNRASAAVVKKPTLPFRV